MAMDSLAARTPPDSVVVVARDAGRRGARVPPLRPDATAGPAMSLSFMRRDRDDAERPDGVPRRARDRAAARARDRGAVAQLRRVRAASSHAPRDRASGCSGGSSRSATGSSRSRASTASTRSSTPRWEPRYLVFEGAPGLPRAGSPRCASRASSRRSARVRSRGFRAGSSPCSAPGSLPWTIWLGALAALAKGRGALGPRLGRLRPPPGRVAHRHRGDADPPAPLLEGLAAASAALLVADAWFDTVTASTSGERWFALGLALGAELPVACVCALLARPSASR